MTIHADIKAGYIVDVDAWTGASVERLRLGTHTFNTLPSDIPPNAHYMGVIGDVGTIERSIYGGTALSGDPQVSQGYVEFSNGGDLDNWLNYGFDGRALSLYRLNVSKLYSSRQTIFTGTMTGIDSSNAWTKIRLLVRDRLKELDTPLLIERYAGTATGPAAIR